MKSNVWGITNKEGILLPWTISNKPVLSWYKLGLKAEKGKAEGFELKKITIIEGWY
jgi:hypothetical protein